MRKIYIGFFAIISGLFLLFMVGCKSSSNGPTSPYSNNPSPSPSVNPYIISMAGNTFSPSSLTVPIHTTITWNNNSAIAHTSTSDTGVWDTGNIAAGSSSQTTFDVAGMYHYHCKYHSFMVGVITVQ
jgi:plastocyanin